MEAQRQQILVWMDAEEQKMAARGFTPSKRWYAARQTAGTIEVRTEF